MRLKRVAPGDFRCPICERERGQICKILGTDRPTSYSHKARRYKAQGANQVLMELQTELNKVNLIEEEPNES